MSSNSPSDRAAALVAEAIALPAAEREAYLVEACGDDAGLLDEVRALLSGSMDATVAADGSGKTSGRPVERREQETENSEEEDDDDSADPLSLLRAFREVGGSMPAPATPLTEKAGDLIGPYKLLQEIGEGGFGTVWMAEQSEPIQRRVALKVIKAGMDTKEVLARFEAERQAVAMMDHPNIAKVLDAGATRTGRPYFAMELVKGVPITRYCDEHGLGTRERLALFRDVCDAVNHAHQKGIIHRDIKPNNVLVTRSGDRPVVKVIDFGIAKATQGRLTDKTLFTRFEEMIGTPVYMSPEQAGLSSLDIDTRSDVYALGVLLYELLTGSPPFDGKALLSAGYEEMRRIIREEEPPLPSLRLSTSTASEDSQRITRHQGLEPVRLSRLVRGDLDWIVMKAIDKDRTRRYETANAFGADIGRFLADEPVLAAAPSAAYQFAKFARRNKAALGMAAVIAFTLLAATAVSTWQAVRATRAEEVASQEAERALEAEGRATLQAERALAAEGQAKAEADRAVAAEKQAKAEADRAVAAEKQAREEAARARDAEREASENAEAERLAREEAEEISNFLIGAFRSPDPSRSGRTVTVAETLDQAAGMLRTSFGIGPERRARLRATIANTYHSLGLDKEAITLQEQVRDFYLDQHGPDHRETLQAMGTLASLYGNDGRRDDAESLGEEVFRRCRDLFGENDSMTLSAKSRLAGFHEEAGRKQLALQMREEVLEARIEVDGEEDIATLRAKERVAEFYAEIGKRQEALVMLQEVRAAYEKLLGENDLETIGVLIQLAFIHKAEGRTQLALEMLQRVRQAYEEAYGENHPAALGAMTNEASALGDSGGRLGDAIALQERSLAIKRRVLPENHQYLTTAMYNLAGFYAENEQIDRALAQGEELVALSERVNGRSHPITLAAMGLMAHIYGEAGLEKDALAMEQEVVRRSDGALPPHHPQSLIALNNVIASHAQAGQWDQAIEIAERRLGLAVAHYPADHEQVLHAVGSLAGVYRDGDRIEDAAATLAAQDERLRLAGYGDDSDIRTGFAVQMRRLAEHHALDPPPDKAIRRYYETNLERFREVSLRLHLMSFSQVLEPAARDRQREKVEGVLAGIVGGRSFAAAAREHSQDSWAKDGGDRGRIERGTFAWELERAIFSAEPGVPTLYSDDRMLWLLLVEDREEGEGHLSLDEVSDEIEAVLTIESRDRLVEQWRRRARAGEAASVADPEAGGAGASLPAESQ